MEDVCALMSISIIVPAYNNPSDLRECLSALLPSSRPDSEIIVVDDGSTDDMASVAAGTGLRLLRLPENSGSSVARNHGARAARGDILLFVDADVVVAPGAVARVARTFAEYPEVAAVFGSYDTRPRAQGVVSQYRNLLHHYVHQEGNPEASTFWAGCGAIRRTVFEAVGGFDERMPGTSIEDIELGYRLRQAGYRIFLDKDLRCTHLKRWTLRSVIRTDLAARAVPWARLILERRTAPRDLNLTGEQRVSLALVGLAGPLLLLALYRYEFFALAAAALLAVLVLNGRLYRFFYRQRGLRFAVACVPLHFVYFLCSGLGFLYVWVGDQLRGSRRARHDAAADCRG